PRRPARAADPVAGAHRRGERRVRRPRQRPALPAAALSRGGDRGAHERGREPVGRGGGRRVSARGRLHPAEEGGGRPVSCRILIVEDNPANQLLAVAVLERDGFEVRIAESGPDALRAIGESRPDLVLMDIQLPEMDGLSLTRILKADPATATIPVVAMSAQAMASGCAGFIAKPIDTRVFADQLRGFLQQPAAAESAS